MTMGQQGVPAREISALIKQAGMSQADVARALSARSEKPVSRVAVHYVITGQRKSRRIAQFIAQITGHSVTTLWPGHYPILDALQRRLSTNQGTQP